MMGSVTEGMTAITQASGSVPPCCSFEMPEVFGETLEIIKLITT